MKNKLSSLLFGRNKKLLLCFVPVIVSIFSAFIAIACSSGSNNDNIIPKSIFGTLVITPQENTYRLGQPIIPIQITVSTDVTDGSGYSFTVNPALPAGLNFIGKSNTTDAMIEGIPTRSSDATIFTVTFTAAGYQTIHETFSLSLNLYNSQFKPFTLAHFDKFSLGDFDNSYLIEIKDESNGVAFDKTTFAQEDAYFTIEDVIYQVNKTRYKDKIYAGIANMSLSSWDALPAHVDIQLSLVSGDTTTTLYFGTKNRTPSSNIYTWQDLQNITYGLHLDYVQQNTITFPSTGDMGFPAAGFIPIGNASNDAFTGSYNGNGYSIRNLITARNQTAIGMFGYITTGATLENIALFNNFADYIGTSNDIYIGGLVGYQLDGIITASYTTGNADGGSGNDRIGGLVGFQEGGRISTSYATGNINGGSGNDHVGGLVGWQKGGSISTSYATGNSNGGDDNDTVGGLVGWQNGGNIKNCYATGHADGIAGAYGNQVGGLIGQQSTGSITACYATGNSKGGTGNIDAVSPLLNEDLINEVTVTTSYGFGSYSEGENTYYLNHSPGATTSISSAKDLNASNSGNSNNNNWDTAIWDFGTSSDVPALKDASGNLLSGQGR